ncbi:MAG TPA: non-canonical purine NTP diphosphatase [Bacteroidales bacterium]|nr:non-canonical purine NTP diphosphatase [Bacteroidales bacterium]
MKEIVFATNNKHKLEEIRHLAGDHFVIKSLAEIGCYDDIPETADTLQGNALIKARYIKNKFGLDCFADDTGLEVDALGGRPGVFSARYAGDGHDFMANMVKLLDELNGITNRTARFRTVIVLITGDKEYFFEGHVNGTIISEMRGAKGFGYDPVFVPDGYDTTFAQMSLAEKNTISHRAIAAGKLALFLKQTFD